MIPYWTMIKRPFKRALNAFLGTICYMTPIMNLITGPFATGYILEGTKKIVSDDYGLPNWEEWESMWTKGIMAAIISLFYFIPSIFFAIMTLKQQTILTILDIFLKGKIEVLYTVETGAAVLFFVAGSFFAPLAMIRFAEKGLFAAFSPIFIARNVFSRIYITAWIVSSTYSSLLFFIWFTASFLLLVILPAPSLFPHALAAISVCFGFMNWAQKMTRISSLAIAYWKLRLPER